MKNHAIYTAKSPQLQVLTTSGRELSSKKNKKVNIEIEIKFIMKADLKVHLLLYSSITIFNGGKIIDKKYAIENIPVPQSHCTF